jgi:nucleotide-binding universal stress UspA family protein
LDESERSKTAEQYGLHLAKAYNAKVTGLHVINAKVVRSYYYVDASLALGYVGDVKDLLPIEDAMRKKGEKILAEFQELFTNEGIGAETKIIKGIVDEIIVEEGKTHDLIVISQTGEHTHFIKGLMGSTTEPVLHKSATTVLVTPEHYKEIESPFAAYDGSMAAGRALDFACRFCLRQSLPLAILIVEDNAEKSKQAGGRAIDICKEHEIEPEIVVVPGYPEEEILKFARIRRMDLAFLGSHGHTRLREFILGSTTLFVTRNIEIPVFVTR